MKSCDVTNAYFQAAPATRLMLMAQPKGGVPDSSIPPEACFICRVPVYGSVDAGRGFYLRMDFEVKDCEFIASKILPALHILRSKDDRLIGMLATHVDDLLMAYHDEAEENFKKLFAKFTVGKVEECNFRYCGRRFTQDPDFTIHIDAKEALPPTSPQNWIALQGWNMQPSGDWTMRCYNAVSILCDNLSQNLSSANLAKNN